VTTARYDVLVLGVGGMGAAALDHLAGRGVKVIGIEQDQVPSERGSSTGDTRVIRKAYFEDARYVPLLERAYVLWRELEAHAGEPLLITTGCVNLGPPEHPAIVGVRESAASHGLAHEVLDAASVKLHFPAFATAASDVGVFEAEGGFLRVEACTRAHARRAVERGATLRTQARVTELSLSNDGGPGVRVTLHDGSTIEADRAVISPGAWLASAPALRDVAARLPLVVQRQVQLWFRPLDADVVSPTRFPVFIHFGGDRTFYGVPLHGERGEEPGLKVCRHHGGESTTADTLDRVLRDDDVEQVRAWMRAHLPAGDGPLLRSRVCMYTSTPDGHFVVGKLAEHPQVVLLGGFSGHGYKMASVIGEIAADLATTGASAFDLGLFDPARFA
jgi:sarcosine oxidase